MKAEARYKELKRTADKLARERDRAEGALRQLMVQLEEGFDCSSLAEAETLLEGLEAKRERMESKLEEMTAAFESKWASLLEDDNAEKD